MKKFSKSKGPAAGKKLKPDLAGFMIKIQEQLVILEKKIDGWIGQGFPKSSGEGVQPKPHVPPVIPPARPAGTKQVHGRRERILHKAVCADCHKDCEIPFKPSGERPVYCKECFSKRKAGGSGKPRIDPVQGAGPQKESVRQAEPVRHVVVTKKGVGKVTVSEIARPSGADSRRKRK